LPSVIDVIHDADVLAQLEEVFYRARRKSGFRACDCLARVSRPSLHVNFQAGPTRPQHRTCADEAHCHPEKIRGGFERWWIAGRSLRINFDERFLGKKRSSSLSKVRERTEADVIRAPEEDSTSVIPAFGERLPEIGGQRLIGFEEETFAGSGV